MNSRRSIALVSSLALLAPLAAVSSGPAAAAAAPTVPVNRSAVILDWEETAIEVVYLLPRTVPPGIPSGVPYLGFTAVAMHHAVEASLARRNSSEIAAAAVAAFHVLAEYFPDHVDHLLAQKHESLGKVPDGRAKHTGRKIGRAAATAMIASRTHDGRHLEGKVFYQREPAPGVWQPPAGAPPTGMAFSYLGFVDRLLLDSRVHLNGPDALDSEEYAADFNEVKRLGSDAPATTDRQAARQATAKFFNYNAAIMVPKATVGYLRENPMGMRRTALLFAAMHGAMTDSVINAFRLKYDLGYWRPYEAIAQARDDGNPDTAPQAGWTPLLPNPSYSEYVSGHASATAPAVQVVRRMLGERTTLTLVNPDLDESRTYHRLTVLERQASHSRIWGGFHFRDAMDDGYRLGHVTASRVLRELGVR